jgi:hypothetical protein
MSANACSQFLQMASVAATSSSDSGMADQILLQARLLASAMQDLLNSTKDVASKKTPENIKSLSQHNAAAILEAQRMNQLLGQGGAGASPEAAQAIKSIDNLVIQFDNNSIQCRASTRESLLNEFLKAAKDMARVTSGLVSSTRVSASKHGMYSKEASSVIENLIVASKSAFVSDGTTAAMSHEGNTICRASEAICASPKDAKETIENMRKINGAATKLIATAKERSQNEQNKVKKTTIVANVQNVVNALNGLTQTARSVVVSQPQTVQALSKAASDLKNHVQDLETAMQPELDEEHAEENRVDGAVAQELAEVTRYLSISLNSYYINLSHY